MATGGVGGERGAALGLTALQEVDLAHEEDVEVARRCYTEDKAGAEKADEGYGIGNLCHGGLERSDRRRCNLLAGQRVYDACDDNIDGCCDALLNGNGTWEVARWIFHLGQHCWESLVTGVCERDVEEGGYGLRESWVTNGLEIQRCFRVSWSLNTECDHDDEDSGDDGGGAGP